jgi:nucleoid-associated protein YgaU
LPPGDHQLTLRYQVGTQERDSEQSVTVSVPARQSDKVVAALTAPNQPTTVLNEPRAAEGTLAIRTVEAGQEGAFFATGTAVAGSTVRLYLNGTFIADVRGAADGKWLLKVEKGMAAGHYEVRADMLEPTTSKVAARVEVPFDNPVQAAAGKPAAGRSDKPETAAAGPATPAPATQTATSSSSQQAAVTTEPATSGVAVVSEIQSVTVLRGDSLWRISRRVLGRGIRYTQIYEANSSQIRDPNRIWPGQVLVAPAKAD